MSDTTQQNMGQQGTANRKTIGQADRRFNLEGIGLTLVMIALIVIFGLINPRFATLSNLLTVLTQASTYVIIAMGMTFVISKGGIDLSVGSMLGLVTCVFFGFIDGGLNPVLALVIMFLLAIGLGVLNGLIIAFLSVPALIATLGAMVGFRGLALLHSEGELYYGLPGPIAWLGQGDILGLPAPVLIAGLFVGLCYWLFNHTRFGVHVRAVGGNREAARLAGVPVNLVEVAVYGFIGFTVALGGLLWIARIDGTQATLGTALEIHIIASVIIGGTSLFGGRGTIYGSLLGALLLSMLNNALVIAGVEYFWQLVAIGAIVIIAVTINNIRENRIGWIGQLRGRLAAKRG